MAPQPGLARRLGTGDAVVLGMGAMLGAGVFAAWSPAARAAGSGLLLGLALAAATAFCNATSSAQLAASSPVSGGAYVYGRERLGEWWGFLAGWGFAVGKTASCAAMALTFAAYAAPGTDPRLAAVPAVLVVVAVNLAGVTRTAGVTRVLVAVVLVVLAVVVAAGLLSGGPDVTDPGPPEGQRAASPYGVLQSAGLLFFAFAGYARLATLGEEVRDPERTIPRAVVGALGLVTVVYAAVAVAALHALGPSGLAASSAPLAAVVDAAGWAAAEPVVRLGAAAAALGALLGLVAGVGRTCLAMARGGDLPAWLAGVSSRTSVPHRAELAVGAAVCGLVLVADLRSAIGFSSFGVLLYYLVADLAAWRQPPHQRRYPKALQGAGAGACVVLVAALPLEQVAVGTGVLAVGVAVRAVRLRRSRGAHVRS